ncbi:unannotated protein [freshwater metagenome]|uniref:Unannotated protein n=1 Tax=freshwater metagenome TaxID=449393 RepID=A0A6J7JUS3_9ZZZZ
MKISTLSPAAIPTFLIRAQNDSGVRWLGGVFIKSRTIWVFSAITVARLIAALASALLADFAKIVTDESTAFRSDLDVPRNSSKA